MCEHELDMYGVSMLGSASTPEKRLSGIELMGKCSLCGSMCLIVCKVELLEWSEVDE